MGRPAKKVSKPRPGKTQTNRFSRVGPTLVAWMQAQEEGNEDSLEAHFQKELKDRGHAKLTDVNVVPDRIKVDAKKRDEKITMIDAKEERVSKGSKGSKGASSDTEDDESEACSDFGTMSDAVGDEDSETSYAEREADYGSSEDECLQIEKRMPRTFSLRNRNVRPMIVHNNVHTLQEEEFVPE
jgi:hypothetical protein